MTKRIIYKAVPPYVNKMNKKIILSISLIFLIGLSIFVYAQNWAGESGAPIYKGWNLVYGFANPGQLDGQSFEKSNIKAIYAFNPLSQQYIRMYPNKEETSITGDFLSQTAFWVYSDAETGETFNGMYNGVEYWLYGNPMPYNERQLYKGWNFVGATVDIIDKKLSEISGTCNIESSYIWNPEDNKWETGFGINQGISKDILGSGILIKVSENCKLGTPEGDIPSIPNLPSDSGSNQEGCSDTDQNSIYIKGTVVDKYGSHQDSCVLEEWNDSTSQWDFNFLSACDKTIDNKYSSSNPSGSKTRCVVNEITCINNENGADNYYCPNGCSDGACIQ